VTCQAGPRSSLALAVIWGVRSLARSPRPMLRWSRSPGPVLAELAATSANIHTEVADAADATVAWSLLDHYEPEVLILVAGANPLMRPLQCQTW
jgi:hypothetical protein